MRRELQVIRDTGLEQNGVKQVVDTVSLVSSRIVVEHYFSIYFLIAGELVLIVEGRARHMSAKGLFEGQVVAEKMPNSVERPELVRGLVQEDLLIRAASLWPKS